MLKFVFIIMSVSFLYLNWNGAEVAGVAMFYPGNLLLCCVLVTSKSQMFGNEGIGYSSFTSPSTWAGDLRTTQLLPLWALPTNGLRAEDCLAPPTLGSPYQWDGELRIAQPPPTPGSLHQWLEIWGLPSSSHSLLSLPAVLTWFCWVVGKRELLETLFSSKSIALHLW